MQGVHVDDETCEVLVLNKLLGYIGLYTFLSGILLAGCLTSCSCAVMLRIEVKLDGLLCFHDC